MSGNDKKLERFLQTNRPEAPRAPERELDQILAKTARPSLPKVWAVAAPVAMAAGMLVFLYLGNGKNGVQGDAELESFLEDTFSVTYSQFEEEEF